MAKNILNFRSTYKMRRINSIHFFSKHYKDLRHMSTATDVKQATSSPDAITYCANIVRALPSDVFWYFVFNFTDRQHDYENYLATLLLTKSIRSPAIVLRAYNVEVARIQDQTSDVQTAAFRLQFWQDIIKSIFKKEQTLQNIPANPIAQELFKICCCYSLHRKHLERLITSRSGLLKTKYFRSLEDIERYAEDSVSAIYYLLLGVAGVTNVHADHVASHLGKAQGIANILRSIYVSNQHKMILLPMETLMQHKLSQEDVLRGTDSYGMREAVFEIATRANSHLEKARKIKVPMETNQIFLPAVAVNAYLTKLQKCNFNIFDKSLHRGNATLPFTLYYNRFRNKY